MRQKLFTKQFCHFGVDLLLKESRRQPQASATHRVWIAFSREGTRNRKPSSLERLQSFTVTDADEMSVYSLTLLLYFFFFNVSLIVIN